MEIIITIEKAKSNNIIAILLMTAKINRPVIIANKMVQIANISVFLLWKEKSFFIDLSHLIAKIIRLSLMSKSFLAVFEQIFFMKEEYTLLSL